MCSRTSSPTGKVQQANGTVYKTNDPGKYKVVFDRSPNNLGDYWIVALVREMSTILDLYMQKRYLVFFDERGLQPS